MMQDRPVSSGNPKKGDAVEIYQKPDDPMQDFRKNPCTFIKAGRLTAVRYFRSHHAPTAHFTLEDGSTYRFGGYGGNSHRFCYRVAQEEK